MYKVFDVVVDTMQKSKHNNIVINTNDLKSAKLNITINQSLRPFVLTGATVRIAIVKPDAKTVFQDCTITDATKGKCEVTLNSQAYIIKGLYVAEIMVYIGSDKVAVTGTFTYSVQKGILSGSTLESTNDWQAINKAIVDAEGILKDIREKGTGVDAQARDQLQSVNVQLAQKANQSDVIRKGYGTLNDFDEPTRATIQGLAPGQINAVLGERNVKTPNLDDKAVTQGKTSFAKQGKNKFDGAFTKGVNLTGTYPNVYYDDFNFPNPFSIVFKAERAISYTISKSNDTDRFTVATFIGKPQRNQSPARAINAPTNLVNSVTVTLQGSEDYIVITVSSNTQSKIPAWVQIEEGLSATSFSGYDNVKFNLTDSIEEKDLKTNAVTARTVDFSAMNKLGLVLGSPEKLENELNRFEQISNTSNPFTFNGIKSVTFGNSIYFDCNIVPNNVNGILKMEENINMIFKVDVPDGDYNNVEIYIRNHRDNLNLSTSTKYAEYIGDGYYSIPNYKVIENRTHRVFVRNIGGNPNKKIKDIFISTNGIPSRGGIVDEIDNLKKRVSGNSLTRYVAPNGNDNNTGAKNSPYLTFQKAIDEGATKIIAQPGDYVGQRLLANSMDNLTILVDSPVTSQVKPKARIVNALDLSLSHDASVDLFTANLTVNASSNWHKVFVSKELTGERTGLQSVSYNAILWETNTGSYELDYKMVPVLTLSACQSTEGTFFFDGSKVYVHPKGKTITNKLFKRLINEEDQCVHLQSINSVLIEDLEVSFAAGVNIHTEDCLDTTFRSVDVAYSAYSSGFTPRRTNGNFYNCKGYKNNADGFAPVANGNTNFYNCFGMYNYDDGLSHHDGCTGVIEGGEYHHNVKGGLAPAHGAQVDLFNVISHNNGHGIYAQASSDRPVGRKVRHVNVVTYDNRYGISVQNYHVVAYNCKHENNQTPVWIRDVGDPKDRSFIEL
ncbi:DUF2479 domain-containing protein [Bacillus lacus]|uniref:DUF2479 domain-containing protein n=1 Tax=Metabacillus lacus TaxID=1983721 RepID=A0A7X2IW48_9BACI|nr:BppU family phage baseplate upper protein [Metabacillus lacus]MRX70841.1 DUF2479 domain-containing protein [Metabacillus lacus]